MILRALITADRPFDDLSRFTLNDQKDYTWQTRVGPTGMSSQWLSAALQSSHSDWHCDAGAMDTFIHVAAGATSWMINENSGAMVRKEGWLGENDPFFRAFINEGDDLCVTFFLVQSQPN